MGVVAANALRLEGIRPIVCWSVLRLNYSANCNLIPGSATQDSQKVTFYITKWEILRDTRLSPGCPHTKTTKFRSGYVISWYTNCRFYHTFAKECPWVEYLTSLSKRGVSTLSSISAFNHERALLSCPLEANNWWTTKSRITISFKVKSWWHAIETLNGTNTQGM